MPVPSEPQIYFAKANRAATSESVAAMEAGPQILIVVDDAASRKLLAKMLATGGYRSMAPTFYTDGLFGEPATAGDDRRRRSLRE